MKERFYLLLLKFWFAWDDITNIRGSVSSAFQTRRIPLKILRSVARRNLLIHKADACRKPKAREISWVNSPYQQVNVFSEPLLVFVCEVHNSLSNNRVLESSRPRFVLLIRFNFKKGRLKHFPWTWWRVFLQSTITPKCETT